MRNRLSFFFFFFLLAVISCDRSRLDGGSVSTIPLTRSEEVYAEVNNDFSSELLQIYYDKKEEAYDFVLSPVSLQMFLGMLNAAASEEQSGQMNRMLGYEGGSADGINSFCKKVLETSPKLDPKVTVGVANQWWLNSAVGFKLFPAFSEMLQDYYQVKGETRDFSTEPMDEITRSWISSHTRGMIDVGCPPPYPRQCVLASVSYFKADWQDPFDLGVSFSGDFSGEDGSIARVTYMTRQFDNAELYYDEVLQSLYLPLGEGAFQMEFYLPREGKKIQDVISALRNGGFPKMGESGPTDVYIPSFDLLSSNLNIENDFLNHFHVSICDLDRSPAKYPLCGEDKDGTGMEVNSFTHVARIIVNEKGAEAAAVSMDSRITMNPDVRYFHATRPFVFLIREKGSGIVFFSGVYAGGKN